LFCQPLTTPPSPAIIASVVERNGSITIVRAK
jgi:hypothetical protein